MDHAWGDCLDGCPGTSKGRVASPKRISENFQTAFDHPPPPFLEKHVAIFYFNFMLPSLSVNQILR